MAHKDAWTEIISTNVQEYISTVKFSHPDFSVKEFKKELQNIVGMIPAVDLKWKTETVVNELKRDAGVKDYTTITDKVTDVKVYFTYVDNNGKTQPVSLHYII